MKKQIYRLDTEAKAIFLKRPNKYIAVVNIVEPFKEKNVLVHVHDPGRLKEILFEGNELLLKYEKKPHRKTEWDVIAGKVDNNWVLIHSGYHRKIAENIFKNKILDFSKNFTQIKAEVKYKNHRIDFLGIKGTAKTWIEVKGCTLEKNNIALFPDAPTIRGVNHLKTLLELKNIGDNAVLLILIFAQNVKCFMPNNSTDKEFAKYFNLIIEQGVEVYPISLSFIDNKIFFNTILPLCEF